MESPKRTQDSPPEASSAPPAKRVKALKACTSCRKHKTRCELYDNLKCHRCNVLGLTCSFEHEERPPGNINLTSAPTDKNKDPPAGPESSQSISQNQKQSDSPEHSNRETILSSRLDHAASGSLSLQPTWATSSNNPRLGPDHPDDKPGIAFHPAELLPTPNLPWGIEKEYGKLDWTNVSMVVMQDILQRRDPWQADSRREYTTPLPGVLPNEQITHLLSIFDQQYSPWLNLSNNRDIHSPPVVLARCFVASRHLGSNDQRVSVASRLHIQVNQMIPRLAFSVSPTTEAIQTLLILSLWAPVASTLQIEPLDRQLLLSSAISLAISMRLDRASAHAKRLRDQRNDGARSHSESATELSDAIDKARLWVALANAESMQCVGTDKPPRIHRSEADLEIVKSSSVATRQAGGDMRSNWLGQLYDLVEETLNIRLNSMSEFEKWYTDMVSQVRKMDLLSRILAPLPVTTEYDASHYNILQIHYHVCRLQVLMVQFGSIRHRATTEKGLPDYYWHTRLDAAHKTLVYQLGSDLVGSAQMVLVSFLQMNHDEIFGTAPDDMFVMIACAAWILTLLRVGMLYISGRFYSQTSDSLFHKTANRLQQSACGPDHIAHKSALVVTSLITQWEQMTQHLRPQGFTQHNEPHSHEHTEPSSSTDHQTDISSEQPSPPTANTNPGGVFLSRHVLDASTDIAAANQLSIFNQLATPEFLDNYNLARVFPPDLFLDRDFWSSINGIDEDSTVLENIRRL